MPKKMFVVIGTSAAGLAAVQKIRQLDQAAEIIVVSDEQESPYNKCLLADFLSGDKTVEQTYTKSLAFFEEQRITLRLSTRIVAIDRAKKQLVCFDGSTIEYDALLLAVGGKVTIPPFLQEKVEGVFFFHTLAHALELKAWLAERPHSHAVIMGGGLTGLEVADALKPFSVMGTVVEAHDQLLKRHLDAAGATFLQSIAHREGMTVICKTLVEGISSEQGKLTAVHLSDGRTIVADTLVCALGSRPRLELALQAGLALDHGALVTDQFLKTDDPAIWAAGDVALVTDRLTGAPLPSVTWPDAIQQGHYAAYGMVGQPRAYPGIMPVAYSAFFDLSLHSAGFLEIPDLPGWTVEVYQDQGSYVKVIFDELKVVQGFICLGSDVWQLVSYKRSFMSQTPWVA